MIKEIAFQKYTTADDRRCARRLIDAILETGATISVNDGEEWTLKRSSKAQEVKDHLATSGEDWLRIDLNGERMGSFYLIWDNGSEGDPMILIADYTDNDFMESIYRKVEAQF